MFTGLIISDNGNISAIVNSTPYTVALSHPNYAGLTQAVKDKDADEFVRLHNFEETFKEYVENIDNVCNGRCTVIEGQVLYDNEPVNDSLNNRIISMMRQGFDFEPMLRFIENLMQNPSARSVEQLYQFAENKNLPITEDGYLLAYKTLRHDWKDKYSGRIDNSIGQVVRVSRNKVDDDPNSHCSFGLHVGAWAYAGDGGWYNNHGDIVVLVKVNPRDAVAVPTDHNFTKMRVCEYTVLERCQGVLNNAAYTASNDESVYDQEEYEESDDFEECDFFSDVEYEECDLQIGTEFKCFYTDKYGDTKLRHAEVDAETDNHFVVVLCENDPSFNIDENYENCPSYRIFTKGNLEDIKIV